MTFCIVIYIWCQMTHSDAQYHRLLMAISQDVSLSLPFSTDNNFSCDSLFSYYYETSVLNTFKYSLDHILASRTECIRLQKTYLVDCDWCGYEYIVQCKILTIEASLNMGHDKEGFGPNINTGLPITYFLLLYFM